ncbi:hypothetical protein D0A37_06170 [Microcoleus vaginatus HSN003]|nr:hypothetical protein D0A37_06170 [Microcoleus vaginatus HSN003]
METGNEKLSDFRFEILDFFQRFFRGFYLKNLKPAVLIPKIFGLSSKEPIARLCRSYHIKVDAG